MKRYLDFNFMASYLLLFVLFSTAILLAPYIEASQEPASFRICIESQNNMPFVNGSDLDNSIEFGLHGALPDLLILTAKELDLQLDFVSLPWKRCIQELKQGRSDALFAAIWSEEREVWGVFPKKGETIDSKLALWFADYSVYSRIHSDLKWDGIEFSGLDNGVGAPFGYIAYQKLERLKALPTRNIGANEAFPLVAKGRLDGYVIERTIGDRYLQEHKLGGEVVRLTPSFMQVHWYVPVSHLWYKRNRELTQEFWNTLASIRESRGDKLLAPYLLQE